VRRAKIAKLWSLMGSVEGNSDNIRKFEEIGTHAAANQLAIAEAMTFHQSIGVERKAARLRYLRERWSRRLEQLPGVRTLTSYDPAQSCGIGLLSIAGMDHAKLTNTLWEKHRILVTSINTEGEYEGIRVTPNVYTTLAEVDRFCEVIEGMAGKA
jgi:selenocysteine lyase/cysteine desulfurase